MESGIKRTQRDYTLAFKLAVVEQVEKGELTYKEAPQRYGIQGRSTVLVWLRKHGRLGWSPAASSAAMPLDKTKGPPTPEQQIKALQVQLAEIEGQLQFARQYYNDSVVHLNTALRTIPAMRSSSNAFCISSRNSRSA